MTQRLPIVGGDDNTWGTILNDFLDVEHNSDGTLKIRTDGTLAAYLPLSGGTMTGKLVVPSLQLTSGSPTSGQVLTTDSSGNASWQTPTGGSGGSSTLAGDTDVAITSPTNTQVLTYNGSKWTNQAAPTGAVTSVAGRTGAVTLAESDIASLSSDLSTLSGDITSIDTSLSSKADDSAVVHNTGNETVAGTKTFTSSPVLPSAALPESAVANLTTDLSNKVQLGGDIGGSVSSPTVAKLQGTTLNGSSPADGQVLTYSQASSAWLPGTVSSTTVNNATNSTPGIIILDQDLGGTASNPLVVGLQGQPVSNTTPTSNQVLTYNGSSWGPATPSSGFTNPMTTLGDIIYENSSPAATRLAGNTTTTKKFLTQTGTGSVSAAPTWGTIATTDVPTLNQSTTGNAATATTASGLTSATTTVSVSSATAPTNGQVLTATSSTAATWQAPSGGGVSSFNTRTGAVTLEKSDVTGTGLAASDVGALSTTNNLSDASDANAARANIHIPALTPAAAVATTNLSSLSGFQTIDGYTLASGDLVLLTAQSAASQNGLWAAASGSWTRPTEFATGSNVKGRTCAILNGTNYGASEWVLESPTSGVTVDTSSQTWAQAGSKSYAAAGTFIETFTPENYGAAGNGTTDDTAAIAATITAAGVGGTIYFAKTYLVSSALAPLSSQWWYGPGTLKIAANNTNSIISATGVSNVQIGPGLIFDGNQANQTAANYDGLILLTSATFCTFVEITVQNTWGGPNYEGTSALTLVMPQYCKIRGCYFTNVGYGPIIGSLDTDSTPMYGNSITDCIIETTFWDSIFLTENMSSDTGSTVHGYLRDTVIANCRIMNSGDAGVEVGSGNVGAIITGVTVDNTAVAMKLTSSLSTSGAITSLPVTTYASLPAGLTLYLGSPDNNQTWVTRTAVAAGATSIPVVSQTPNYAYPSGSSLSMGTCAVIVRDSTDVNIADCLFRNIVSWDSTAVSFLNLNSTSSNISISNCQIDSVDSGISDQAGVTGLTVAGCTINNFCKITDGSSGIYLDGTSTFSITGTLITNGSGTPGSNAGIACSGAHDGTITGCQFLNNQGNDALVMIGTSYDIVVAGNRFGPSNAQAMTVYDSGSYNISVLNNDFTGQATTLIFNGNAGCVARGNLNYNPVGSQTVAVPGSGTAVAAAPIDRTFYVTAASSGTTKVAISGGPTITIPASTMVAVKVPATTTLTPTYSTTPTWVVEGE